MPRTRRRSALTPRCALCAAPLGEAGHIYPDLICHRCDERAVNAAGAPARLFTYSDEAAEMADADGDNPVFIDGRRCWRRYRQGGYVTMLETLRSGSIRDFYAKHSGPWS